MPEKKSKFQISSQLDGRIRRIISNPNGDTEFDQLAYILGFNYGNITNCVGLTNNYQLHHAVFPVVGIVFFTSSPAEEEIKASLRSVREFSSSGGLGRFCSDKNEHLFLIYSVSKASNDIEKSIERRIFNFTKGAFVRRRRLRLNILNDPSCPRQVHRASEELFTIGDSDSMSSEPQDTTPDHVLIFVHGVGGVCDVRFRSCVEVVADFKKMANNLLQHSTPSSGASTPTSSEQLSQQLKRGLFRKSSSESSRRGSEIIQDESTSRPSSQPSIRQRRVECIPISWHSCTRRQTGMNEQLSLISLSSVPKLRHFLNRVVIDALLYSSGPVYAQTILNNVGDEINEKFQKLLEKYPNFNGSVSLAGHSLGSVILWDLLAHQIPTEPICVTSENTHSHNNKNSDSDDRLNVNGEKCETNMVQNKRRQCMNVSHEHHDLDSTNNMESCNDYKNLEELLRDMNLTEFASVFKKEHIDIQTLLLLTDLDMKELKLPLGARRKLGTYINFKKVSKFQAAVERLKNTQQQEASSPGEKQHSESNIMQSSILSNDLNTGQYLLKYPQLKFKPKCFFSFGSPMSMFFNVRGVGILSKEYKFPTCDKFFNIYHPFDPLAYRIEPLIDSRFKKVEPVQIPHSRGGKRIHVQLREGFARVGQDFKHRFLGSLKNTWSTFTSFNTTNNSQSANQAKDGSARDDSDVSTESKRRRLAKSASSSIDVEVESFEGSVSKMIADNVKQTKKELKRQNTVRSQSDLNIMGLDSIIENSVKQSDLEEGVEDEDDDDDDQTEDLMLNNLKSLNLNDCKQTPHDKQSKKVKKVNDESFKENSPDLTDVDTSRIGQLNNGRRIDYVLQEKPIELFNEYIFAFTSHANYWLHEDSALMMLNEVYQIEGLFDSVV